MSYTIINSNDNFYFNQTLNFQQLVIDSLKLHVLII